MKIAITHILILVLCFGPTFSLNLSAKANAGNKPVGPAPKRGPVPVRKMKPIFAARPQANAILPGQSLTLLGDGRSVLIGGEVNNRAVDTVTISDGVTGAPVPMRSKLHQARAWHSATMLPDGSVLVLGGIGKNGEVLKSAELLDPERQTFTTIPVPEIAAA